MSVTYKELEKLDYFNFLEEDLSYRFIPMFPIFANNNWKMYIDTNKGLLPLNIKDIADGFYISENPIMQDDLKLDFFNLMYKRNNHKENIQPLNHIYDDIYNLSASIEKINFFSKLYTKEDHFRLCKYASVELESIFQNSRAIFENLQIIQNNLIKNTKSANDDNLFSVDIVQFGINKNRKILTIEEYQEQYKIPELLAKFYVNFQEFFFFILELRNDIFHSRKSFSLYLGEEGFSISLKDYNLENLHFWNNQNTMKNDLGSLKSLIAYITLNCIHALEEYSKTISLLIELPNDILPDYNIFLRSDFNKILKKLYTYSDINSWNERKEIETAYNMKVNEKI